MPAASEHTDLGLAFTQPSAPTPDGTPATLRLRSLGTLTLEGPLVACDPFALRNAPPAFTVALPTGTSAAVVCEASTASRGPVAAALLLRLAPRPVSTWTLATTAGQALETLSPGEFFGFGVDAGWACLLDGATLTRTFAALGVADLAVWRGLPRSMNDDPAERERLLDAVWAHFDAFDEELLTQIDAGEPWPPLTPDAPTGRLVACPSGFGDGAYPTWIGADAGGAPVAVAVDFGVLAPMGPDAA